MRTLDFLRNTASTLGTRLLVMGLTFLIGIVTARALGPKGVGAFSLAVLLPSLASLFLQFGIGPANIYFMGRGKYPTEVLLANALTLSLITSLAVLPVYWLLIPVFLRTVAVGMEPVALMLVGLAIPLALVGGHLSYIFLGLQRIQEYNLLNLVRNGSMLLLILVLVVAFRAGVTGAVAAMLAAWIFMVLRALWALRGVVGIRLGWDWAALKDCLVLGVKGYLGNLFQFFNYRLDVLIVSYFLGFTEVGLYATAVAAAEILWYMPEAVATVLFPRTAGASHEEARSFTPRVSRNVFLLTGVAGVLLALLSHPVVVILFSSRYEHSVQPLRLLLPGVVMLSISKVLASDLAGRGLLMYNTWAALTALVVTVIGDLVLIPSWGISGAAVASSASYVLTTLVLLALYIRVSGNSLAQVLIPTPSDWSLYRVYWARLHQLVLVKIRERTS